jgi:hypothetical protein
MTYLPFKEEVKQQKTAKRILEEQNYQIILNELSEQFEAKMADECRIERYLWKGTKESKDAFAKFKAAYKERFSKQKVK